MFIGFEKRRGKRGILLWSVDVEGNPRIVDRNVFNLALAGALDFARRRCFRSFEEGFEHRVRYQNWMSMFALVLRNDRPFSFGDGPCEGGLQRLDGRGPDRRTIDER